MVQIHLNFWSPLAPKLGIGSQFVGCRKDGDILFLDAKFGGDPGKEMFGSFLWCCLAVRLGVKSEYQIEVLLFQQLYCRYLLVDFDAVFSIFFEHERAFSVMCKLRNYIARWRNKCYYIRLI